jgi:hypothetical protein
MATPDEISQLTHFAMSEVTNGRSWTVKPGPQHRDDPNLLLGVMQRVKMSNVKLTKEQADKLYQYFQNEAQQYRQTWLQYFPPTGAYDEVLEDIKQMLWHMTL